MRYCTATEYKGKSPLFGNSYGFIPDHITITPGKQSDLGHGHYRQSTEF